MGTVSFDGLPPITVDLENEKQTQEACRIGIHWIAQGIVDVGAPMKHKQLCYDMLRDAAKVIERTPEHFFRLGIVKMAIVMDMTGRVDVSAPLPLRPLALAWLKEAKKVIERYNDAEDISLKPFNTAVSGEGARMIGDKKNAH